MQVHFTRTHNKLALMAGALALVSSNVALAGQVSGANMTTFSAGGAAVAAEVNGNFTELTTQINDNNSRITTNNASISTNATSIANNDARITTNAADIANILTRLTALETPSAPTMSTIAGTWGVVNSTYFIFSASNTAEVEHESLYGTLTIDAAGTFTFNIAAGKAVNQSIHTIFVNPNDVIQGVTSSTASSGSFGGSIALGANNTVTVTPVGGSALNGYVSKNGQVVVLEGHGDTNTNNIMILVRLN